MSDLALSYRFVPRRVAEASEIEQNYTDIMDFYNNRDSSVNSSSSTYAWDRFSIYRSGATALYGANANATDIARFGCNTSTGQFGVQVFDGGIVNAWGQAGAILVPTADQTFPVDGTDTTISLQASTYSSSGLTIAPTRITVPASTPSGKYLITANLLVSGASPANESVKLSIKKNGTAYSVSHRYLKTIHPMNVNVCDIVLLDVADYISFSILDVTGANLKTVNANGSSVSIMRLS